MNPISSVITLCLIVCLFGCGAKRSFVEVERWNNYGLLCGQKPGTPCIVVYIWYNGRILHSEYLPMSIADSTIKADSLKGVEMLKLEIK